MCLLNVDEFVFYLFEKERRSSQLSKSVSNVLIRYFFETISLFHFLEFSWFLLQSVFLHTFSYIFINFNNKKNPATLVK